MNFEMNNPQEFNLQTVFRGFQYVVPIYQRNYAWKKDEIEQLLNDIADSEGNYCIGNLIVDQTDANTFTVIDGQQRLTTLFILLSYLKAAVFEKNSLRFEAREKSNKTLSALFDGSTTNDNSFYSEEILEGYTVIEDYFKTKCAKNSDFKTDFENRFPSIIIIRTQVPKKIDLNHYFEIMNTRGEQLEIHEIAKGRLLSVIADEKDRNIAATIWDACADMNSYIQMNFKKDIREKLFSGNWNDFQPNCFDDIRSFFSEESYKTAKRFSLKEIIESRQSSAGDNTVDSEEENERFESIVSFPNFLLIANETMNFSDNDASLDDKHFLKTLSKHWNSNETALSFIFSLLKLRFLFDTYVIKREFAKDYKDDGRWTLQHLEAYSDGNQKKPLHKLTYSDDKNTQTILLQSSLRITYTAPKTMHWISLVLSKLFDDEKTDITKLLEKYACSKIVEADYKNSKGFAIDRIVFTYLDYVLLRDKKISMPNFYFQFRTSIEHFYPQNPIGGIKWKDEVLNDFGNLALITVSSNSKFSNLPPNAKTISYPDVILQSPKLMLMAELMNKTGSWDEAAVRQHGEEMLSILENEVNIKA